MLYVAPGASVRLAEDVRAKIWVKTAAGTWIKGSNRVTIREGSDVLPPLGPQTQIAR